jgi:hypothetical protein
LNGDSAIIKPAKEESFLNSYRSTPPLHHLLSVEQMTEIAAEEHAAIAAVDGR